MEISITHRCNLLCDHCGFKIPHQPQPFLADPLTEIESSLTILHKLNIHVGSIAIMRGEAALVPRLLEETLSRVRAIGISERLELVTNGLVPKGISDSCLRLIDRLSISTYFKNHELELLWRQRVERVSPTTELIFRVHDQGWDQWWGIKRVAAEKAQEMFEQCWYRKHCITLERSSLFLCSRLPKENSDGEGLAIRPALRIAEVVEYLNRKKYLPSCATCIPMMGLPKVSPGIQPDNRLKIQVEKAIKFLKQ